MGETLTKQLGREDTGVPLSREQFAESRCQPPFKYERVQGRLVVMPPIGEGHRRVARPFIRELVGYWRDHPDVVDYVDPEGWVATSEDDDRIPDLCVYLVGNTTGAGVPERVPDLIYEVVSESRADQERDYIHKRAEYHRIGVREYVVVDRFKRAALVLTWKQDGYAERWLAADQTYTTSLLPGLSVGLGEVFAE